MNHRKAQLKIRGMSCANCSQTIAEALRILNGVVEVNVNFATDEASVEYDLAEVTREQLYDAIENAGYAPVREESEEADSEHSDAARNEETCRQLRLTLFGLALSTPLLAFLAEKILFGGGVLPEMVLGIDFGWMGFLLATPVQVVLGWPFYRNSYTALVKNRTANMDVLIALGSSTAYLYSVAVLLGVVAGGLYFDTAALILVFITLSNYLEARSKGRAGEALRQLLEMEANTATRRERRRAEDSARRSRGR